MGNKINRAQVAFGERFGWGKSFCFSGTGRTFCTCVDFHFPGCQLLTSFEIGEAFSISIYQIYWKINYVSSTITGKKFSYICISIRFLLLQIISISITRSIKFEKYSFAYRDIVHKILYPISLDNWKKENRENFPFVI